MQFAVAIAITVFLSALAGDRLGASEERTHRQKPPAPHLLAQVCATPG